MLLHPVEKENKAWYNNPKLFPSKRRVLIPTICFGETPMDDFRYCKIEVFIPETHLSELQKALQSVDAGHIGNYDSCLSYSQVIGCWRPLQGSSPYIGQENVISSEPELKVEVTCLREKVDLTVDAIRKVHPYEEPVIYVIPLYRTSY
jgi:hypothetical protein